MSVKTWDDISLWIGVPVGLVALVGGLTFFLMRWFG